MIFFPFFIFIFAKFLIEWIILISSSYSFFFYYFEASFSSHFETYEYFKGLNALLAPYVCRRSDFDPLTKKMQFWPPKKMKPLQIVRNKKIMTILHFNLQNKWQVNIKNRTNLLEKFIKELILKWIESGGDLLDIVLTKMMNKKA